MLKRRPLLKVSITILLLICIIFIFACGKKKIYQIKIGYQPLAINLPFFVAIEKGYFQSNGLEVEPVRFETADAAADALMRDDIVTDFCLPMLVFISREIAQPGTFAVYGFQVDTPEHSHEALIVLSDSKITKISDLKGKSIGTFPGVAAKTYLTEALINAGIMQNEIEFRPIQVQLQLQALRAKNIDALFAYEPLITLSNKEGYARTIEWGIFPKYIKNPFPVTVFSFTKKYLKNNPEIAKKIVNSISKAIDFIKNSPEEANISVMNFTAIKDIDLAKILSQPLNCLANDIDINMVQDFIAWHKKVGLIKDTIDIRNLLFSLN